MRFNPQLELRNIFSGYAFFIEFEKTFSDGQWVNLVELYWENHLAISVQFLQHFGVAIFQTVEQDFDLFEHIFFGLRWVYPFG